MAENGGFQPNVEMSDRELAQVTFAMRIFDHDVDISYSTRETADVRNNMATLGVTTMSAESHTDPGGYCCHPDSLAQFDVSDTRTAKQVDADLRAIGMEPVWKNWDRSFDGMRNSFANYITTLTIAGSDSCGGAGIQADIKTMSALGCYAASVITAVTVQNTMGVSAVHAVPPEIVAGQIRAVMDDIKPRAVKVGMVNDIDTINAIADTLANYDIQHLVVDPVMVATSGARLMQDEAVEVFTKKLLPMASLLTPNVPEAEVLAGIPINDKDSMEKAAHIIHSKGCKALLIKGGHIEGRKIDRLYTAMGMEREYEAANVATRNTHGTGCTLSSAITSYLAMGYAIGEAIAAAKEWLTGALIAGANVEIGSGHGPVNHFYNPQKTIIKTK